MSRAGWAALAASACAFVGSWILLGHLWYRSQQIIDTPTYERYGDAIASGQTPYRDFALEYPPGALLAFAAPELTARRRDLGAYDHAFEKWMAGAGVLLTLFATAALTAAAVAALLSGRNELGAVVLGAAIATKLYPAVLVPLGVAWVWRLEGRRRALVWTTLAVATCAAVFLPFAAIAPGGVRHSLGTQLGRPLQIESLGSAILIALHHAAGLAISVHTDHGSQNIESAGAHATAVVTTALGALALCAVWLAFARGPARGERLAAAAAASVATFVAFGKVFSPQFIIWLIPLVPLVRSRLAPLLLAATLVLTQLWFPVRYWDLTRLHARESWLLLARDVLVLALAAVLARGLLEHEVLGKARTRLEALQRVGAQVD